VSESDGHRPSSPRRDGPHNGAPGNAEPRRNAGGRGRRGRDRRPRRVGPAPEPYAPLDIARGVESPAIPRPPRTPSLPPPDVGRTPPDRGRTSLPPPGNRASRPPPRAGEAPRARTPPPAPPRRLFLLASAEPDEEFLLGPAFPEYTWSERAFVTNIAMVRRAQGERVLECDAGELPLRKGESVVIEAERGPELAIVVAPPRRRLLEGRAPARALRRAGEADLATEARTRLREAEAARVAAETVRALQLPAKVVRAEVGPHGGRTTIYLASEERIELRELARRLSGALRGRIELRHVGMRDAAKAAGGIGPCGLQLCCNTFLADFAPVSIRMAKDQGLALNPQRVAGVCGRLMCCLVYEDAFYRAQRAQFPTHGKRVETDRGEGVVRDVDVLARTVRVAFPDGTQATFAVEEVRPLQQGARQGGPREPQGGERG
jgi:cell fate regulator YaaT (PSP1 superfamily)